MEIKHFNEPRTIQFSTSDFDNKEKMKELLIYLFGEHQEQIIIDRILLEQANIIHSDFDDIKEEFEQLKEQTKEYELIIIDTF